MRRLTRTSFFSTLLAVQAALSSSALANDWPQDGHDAARSRATSESLQFPLDAAWTYEPAQPPRPAWEEPAKELHRMDFDYAPQPVIADGRVYFGSSADDTVRALDLKSGEILWRFTAGGPIRFAPAIARGKAYVASDDGWLYCLDAATGQLVWRFRAAPKDDLLLGNGRMISRWPLRCGALVVDGVVYTVAGMWPAEGIHVHALDAATGQVLWRNDSSGDQFLALPHPASFGFSGVAAQGPLAASPGVLLVPTGRSVPAGFDRHTGKLLHYDPGLYALKRNGGSWLSVAGDLYLNPAHGGGALSEGSVGEKAPSPSDGVAAYSLAAGKQVFALRAATAALARGDTLFAAGIDNVAAYDLNALRKGKSAANSVKWQSPHPRAYSLALAGKSLLLGGKGTLAAFDVDNGQHPWAADLPGQIRGLAIAGGRVVATTDKGAVICLARLEGAPGAMKIEDSVQQPFPISNQIAAQAAEILQRAGELRGYALVLGKNGPDLAAALAAKSRLHVIAAVQGEDQAAMDRRRLLATGQYGSRVAVEAFASPGRLPFAPYFADLVVVAGAGEGLAPTEIYRVLRPCGGRLLMANADVAQADRLIAAAGVPAAEVGKDADGRLTIVRGPLPGAGEWRHQKADSGQSGVGQESRLQMPLELLWFGGPGPNRMMDRHLRTSAPLSVNGRVFITGQNDLIAFDAYNGRELWDRPMKGVGRMTADKNAANVVADDKSLYVAIGVECHRISQETGEETAVFPIPKEVEEKPVEWGYVEVENGLLIGSCLQQPYTRREANDCSSIFVLDASDGSLRWKWRAAHGVPCSGIALGGGKLFCLDAQADNGQAKRRGLASQPARVLAALDLADGREAWRVENTPAGRNFVQYAQGIVTVVANAAYDAATGKELWRKTVSPDATPVIQGDWIVAQPAAYNLFTGRPRLTSDTLTGESRPWKFLRAHGCGGIVGCQSLLFFRSGASAIYDFASEGLANFGGVRAGCGLSMIAANGLAILPETSSGCTCSYNYQTSLALVPSSDRRREPWVVLEGQTRNAPATRLNLSFGAPGDRRDDQGAAWLSVPRPVLPGAQPVAVKMSSPTAAYYHHPREDKLEGAETSWLYASGVRDPGRITVDLYPSRPVAALPADKPLVVDGKLDDWLLSSGEGGKTEAPITAIRNSLPSGDEAEEDAAHSGAPEPAPPDVPAQSQQKADIYFRYDNDNLYVAIQSPMPEDGMDHWAARRQAPDSRVWEDDSWELYLTDRKKEQVVHLGLSASGARYDALAGKPATDWNGEWASAVGIGRQNMTVEMAIPWATLQKAGLRRDGLMVNVVGTGPRAYGSPDVDINPEHFSGRWEGWIVPERSETYTFTLRGDDLNSLWIGDKRLIQFENPLVGADEIDPPGEKSASIPLQAGQRYKFKLEHGERRGQAEAKLFWSSPSTPKSIVPASAFLSPGGEPGGLSVSFWNDPLCGVPKTGAGAVKPPAARRVDPNIDFQWGPAGWRAQLLESGELRPGRSSMFCPLTVGGGAKPDKRFTVRLHFAEWDGVQPGRRVFDVKIQNQALLKGFDIAGEAGGCNRPLVKEFRGISAPDDVISIDLVSHAQEAADATEPILSGLEIAAE